MQLYGAAFSPVIMLSCLLGYVSCGEVRPALMRPRGSELGAADVLRAAARKSGRHALTASGARSSALGLRAEANRRRSFFFHSCRALVIAVC